jgi:hypothetical protein
MRKKRLGKDEKREVTPEFVNMSKEILYPQIQGVTAIRYHFLRDHQQKGDIEIAYINTKDQLADIFTKPLDEQTFNKLRHELNILDSRNFL